MNYNLGKMISKARKDKNLSQSALAEKLHVSRQYLKKSYGIILSKIKNEKQIK